jgi:hypothetical protein
MLVNIKPALYLQPGFEKNWDISVKRLMVKLSLPTRSALNILSYLKYFLSGTC